VATERCALDIWSIDHDADRDRVSSMLDLLGGAERVRAARLHTTEERLRFVVVRGAVRTILGRYAGLPPASIRLETTGAGRPFLPDTPVGFSLAHSEGLTVCAVTMNGRIGVDMERIRRLPDAQTIAARCFAPEELRAYAAAPPQARLTIFFRTWTRKEAILKAEGGGLSQSLRDLEVAALPLPAVVRLPTGTAHRDWHLHAFEPAAGYLGAIASDRPVDSLQYLDFSDTFRV
jgi:4'-phosphopantetheinyl transferase